MCVQCVKQFAILMRIIICSLQVDDADNKLKEWMNRIRDFYRTYDKLLFFSVSKVLSFYDILTTGEFTVNQMMQEIGVLFKNDIETAKKLKVAVQVQCSSCTHSIYS